LEKVIAREVVLSIDGREVRAREGERLLWVAMDHDIYIPNLCAMREADLPFGGCRLCFVEIDGRRAPVTACSQPVENGMVVHTDTPKVKQLRRTAFELLLSHHHLDCAHCPKNKKCELQKIAAHQGFKLKLQRLRRIPRDLPIDSSHPLFTYDPNKCVLCGKCIWVCQRHGVGAIDFASRGLETRVSTFDNMPLADAKCDSCLECVRVCPVGSLVAKDGQTCAGVSR
jgi:formate dehydrogenase major subunit/NADH-quinone oxidoreductase subunit G